MTTSPAAPAGSAARPELSIVIPAFNEAATVAGVIAGHRAVAEGLGSFEVVACDDGSADATWSELQAARAGTPELRLLRHERNLGIPRTMSALYAAARGAWTYFAPADGQVPAEALAMMWSQREGAVLVVGRRMPRRDPTSRVLIAQLYSGFLRAIYRLPVRDIDSVKLYRTDELRRTARRSDSNFVEAEILIELCRRGAVVREVDIPHRPRIAGRARGVTPLNAFLAMRDVALFVLRDALARRAR